jgi:16S rRNA processing protein RimM
MSDSGEVDPPAPDGVELEAGRVGRAHGLDGSFYVLGVQPELLPLGGSVRVAGRLARIVSRRGRGDRPILRLEGMSRREDAEALRGEILHVALADAPTLGPGEFWAHELEGCVVIGFDPDGELGVVRAMMPLPSCEALEVVREDGSVLLVPLVRDAVRSVDVAARRIEVNRSFLGLMAGFLRGQPINPPLTSGATAAEAVVGS